MEHAWDKVPENLVPVTVPCAGTVSIDHILTCLHEGAGAVVVAGCFSGNCASLYGNLLAKERIVSASQIIAEAGFDSSRILFLPVAANTPWILREGIQQLERTLGFWEEMSEKENKRAWSR